MSKKSDAAAAALRLQAFNYLDEGWTSEDVSVLLEVRHMTVCGWMSWRTKGHYNEQTGEFA